MSEYNRTCLGAASCLRPSKRTSAIAVASHSASMDTAVWTPPRQGAILCAGAATALHIWYSATAARAPAPRSRLKCPRREGSRTSPSPSDMDTAWSRLLATSRGRRPRCGSGRAGVDDGAIAALRAFAIAKKAKGKAAATE
eukprot:2753092-Pyramimonas_sp.AAC.1